MHTMLNPFSAAVVRPRALCSLTGLVLGVSFLPGSACAVRELWEKDDTPPPVPAGPPFPPASRPRGHHSSISAPC